MTPAQEVFEYWRNKTGHKRARYTQDKATPINARLKDGYTVEDLKLAIDGALGSSWHMGGNDARLKYDSIPNMLSNSTKVDRHIERGEEKRRKAQLNTRQSTGLKELKDLIVKHHRGTPQFQELEKKIQAYKEKGFI